MNKTRLLKVLSVNVILLGIISLLTDASTEMLVPVFPLFLYTVLGAPVWAIGLFDGAAESTASILKAVVGRWSDKIKRRKPFIFAGYGFSTLSKAFFYVSTMWEQVVAFRVIERMGKGIRVAPRDAMIADSTDKEHLGKVYGFHRAMDTSGAVVGVLLALLVVGALALGYRDVFLAALVPAACALVFILFLREKGDNAPQAKASRAQMGRFSDLPLDLRLFIGTMGLLSVGAVTTSFLLLRASGVFASSLGMSAAASASWVIGLYLLFNIIYMGVSIPTGSLSDKIGRYPLIISGYALLAVTFALAIIVSDTLALVMVFVFFGLYFGFTDGVQKALVAEQSPPGMKGTALGAYNMAVGLGALPLALLGGMLWDAFGPWATFSFLAALCLAGIGCLAALAARRRRAPGALS
ncbi:MAG: MFS transporter [Euryarchaeota archaeon]|nr:MFS transporter [Euryarchaeota archaeon]